MKTAYEYERLQIAGELHESEYEDAIKAYDQKIEFLDKCIKEASKFDLETLNEVRFDFVFVRAELMQQMAKERYVRAFNAWKPDVNNVHHKNHKDNENND